MFSRSPRSQKIFTFETNESFKNFHLLAWKIFFLHVDTSIEEQPNMLLCAQGNLLGSNLGKVTGFSWRVHPDSRKFCKVQKFYIEIIFYCNFE